MIRIAYISQINLLSGRTNVYNLAKTCEVLNAQEGFSVKLITTNRCEDFKVFFHKMGVHQPFGVVCLDLTNTLSIHNGKVWYFLRFLFANFRLSLFLIRNIREFDVLYFRDESLFLAVFFASVFMGKRIFFETHSVLENKWHQVLNIASAKFSRGIIAISSGLKHYYQKYNRNILISLCSASEDEWFDYSKSKETFRKQLGLPVGAFLIGYTGVVGANPNNDYYEIDDIVKALALLPDDVVCVIVGEINGNAQWLRDIAVKAGVANRVIILPWQERSVIPNYLQAFDVNLIPKRKKDLIGDSPAKMFPALASQRPIIAGRAECIEEVLTNNVNALIVEENSPAGWAKAILKIYNDHDLGQTLSSQALVTKSKYTWEKRGSAISEFIKRKNVLVVTGNTAPNSGLGRYSLSIIERLGNFAVDHAVLDEGNALYPKSTLVNIVKNCLIVRKALKKYDNIHAFDCWPYGVYAYLAVLGTGKRLFINGVGTYSVPFGNRWKIWLMKKAYLRATKVFCISHYTKKRILEQVPRAKAGVVFLGTTKLPELSSLERANYQQKYNFTSRSPILLTIGAIKERKGQFETLQALAKLKSKYPKVLYLIVGSTSDKAYVAQIEKYVKEFGLEDNVKILPGVGSDTELAYLYSACQVFLLNSNNIGVHFEGFGLVLLEAGQFGKPVIGSRGCGIEDVIENGYNGFLTEQRNPDDIYQKLLLVLGPEYEALARHSQEFSQKFTWVETVATYTKYYL